MNSSLCMNKKKKGRNSLNGGSLHTGGAKSVEKELGRTSLHNEVFTKTHMKKKLNESDPDNWVKTYLYFFFMLYAWFPFLLMCLPAKSMSECLSVIYQNQR
ncbi:hypothetical protein H5410_015242 [Solanum commersonii]|uniref:Uncharacterized protein n=1 Tax=Solanum commersonii TaxID=4109 RepID=A0A9J5ZTT8_SOLCO|nr:hypothetical protein H5410_015242 [Solanum commersonii]